MTPLQEGHPHQVKLVLIGLLALPIIGLYLVVSLPIFIYRWLMSHIVAPFYRPDLGKILDGLSFGLSLEFYDRTPSPFFKSAVVTNTVVLGNIPLSEFVKAFTERVLLATTTTSHGKDLIYPELQQRPTPWMGFMFWKQVKNFNLADYIHLHRIDEAGNDSDSEWFLVQMMEELLNKPFPPDRSPWEVHLIHNYKNTVVSGKRGSKMTAIVIRPHHCLGDGYSLVKLVIGDLLATPQTGFKIVSPKANTSSQQPCNQTRRSNVKDALKLPYQILLDLGYILWITTPGVVTPYHAKPNKKVNQSLFYARSNLIPIQMVKNVKNKFGVTFTSVLLSILSKGVAQNFKKAGDGRTIAKFPIAVIQPLPKHPMGPLTNHLTAVYLDIYTHPELRSDERLSLTEKSFTEQRKSAMRPIISSFLMQIFCLHVAPVTKLLMENQAFATGLSNFATPEGTYAFNGRKCVDFGCTSGTHRGVSGVAFTVLSYDGHIRIGATVESSVMSRDELNDLIQSLNGELSDLNRDLVVKAII